MSTRSPMRDTDDLLRRLDERVRTLERKRSPGVPGTSGEPGAPGSPGGGGNSVDWEPILFNQPGNLVVATGLAWDYVEFDSVLAAIRWTVAPAPTGSDIIVDFLRNGVSVFAAAPHIAAGQETVLAVPDFPALSLGDRLTSSVLQVGSSTPGGNLVGHSRYYAA